MDPIYTLQIKFLGAMPNKKIKGCEWLPNDFPSDKVYPLMYSTTRHRGLIDKMVLCAKSHGYTSFQLSIGQMTKEEYETKKTDYLQWNNVRYELDVFYPIIDQEAEAQIPLAEMDQYLAGNWRDINFWAEGDFCDHDSDSCPSDE